MPDRKDHTVYFQTAFRKNWTALLWPTLGTVGLTLAMFLTIPLLNTSRESSPSLSNLLNAVAFPPEKTEVKSKPPGTRPHEKTEPASSKPEETRRIRYDKRPRPVYTKPEIHLDINTKLASNIGEIALPAVHTLPMMVDRTFAGVFPEDQLDLPLTALFRAQPVYPIQARRRGTEGWVKVLLTVDEKGNVAKTVILDAEPAGIFEKSVKRCISRWRYKPGTVDGVPVKAKIETTIQFKLASG